MSEQAKTDTKLMMLGPAGAGKGTQAQRLADALSIPQISTGDMLRAARRNGTALGVEAGGYMDRGELVPDEVVVGIVAEALKSDEVAGGFILDGFPRTLEQARALADMGVALDRVLNLEVPEETLRERLGGRRSCKNCGAVYHVVFAPPAVEDTCDKCGHVGLFQRPDDKPEAISARFASYKVQTQPLVDFYGERGNLVNIPGEGTTDEVYARIQAALR